MFVDHNKYITPYLPPDAIAEMNEWNGSGKPGQVAFQRVIPEMETAKCRNCQDLQIVYVSYCRAGPFEHTPSHGRGAALIWFEGGPGVGSGWYITATYKNAAGYAQPKTLAYPCPACTTGQKMPELKQWWQGD